jgi:hypothetical protein
LATLFPQESRTLRSNQLELLFFRNILGKLAGASFPIRLQSGGSTNFPAKGVLNFSRPEP